MQERLDAMIDNGTLKDALPHGSGIDGDWLFEEHPGRILCHNGYHGMDECGMYDGWVDFVVILFIHEKDIVIDLKGPCAGQTHTLHRAGDIDWELSISIDDDDDRDFVCGLDEYLGDTIQCALSEAKLID